MLSTAQTNLLAACAVVALVAALTGYLFRRRKPLPLTLSQSFWYGVNYLFTRLLWRARVNRDLPVSAGEGAVIVSNHRSSVDPCFIQLTTRRVVHWMVAHEFCTHWALGWFLRLAEVIPTRRGGYDLPAAKMAIQYASHGGLVGLFPEGTINDTQQFLLPGRCGAAMIALKARVPLVPCYIGGSPYDGTTLGCLTMPARVTVRLGRPIDLSEFYGRDDDRQILEQITRRCLTEIAILAGRPDFEPELAGRSPRPQRTLAQ